MFRSHFQRISVPLKNTSLNVCYLEGQRLNSDLNKKIVVGIHGNPGSSKQFKHILPSFIQNGWQGVFPDYPGFGQTVNALGSYSFTTEGRAEFLSEFLKQKSILKPDVFLSYSSSSFVTIQALSDGLIDPGAIVFVSPPGVRCTNYVKLQLWLIKSMDKIDSHHIYSIYSKMFGMKIRPEFFSSSAKVGSFWDFKSYEKQAKTLKQKLTCTPVIVIYGTEDTFGKKEHIKEFAEILGLDLKHNFISIRKGHSMEALKLVQENHRKYGANKFCIEFKRQGHVLMKESPDLIADLCCLADQMKDF